MTQEPESTEARPDAPPLKVVDPDINADAPWDDDVLRRREVADRLTKVVEGQQAPFVISVDGGWGTGKTFLLKRWQQDLENQGWQAIYFNAWADDFSDDPLLAIIGQLSDYFDDGTLKKAALAVANAALGIITKHIAGTAIHLDDLTAEGLLDDYRAQQETKTTVKDQLSKLASAVHEETGQPLIFIIDELDRCRPTFAIKLLERVKHIFDVDSIVFVFGINRSELVKSLQSVYGEIDAGAYLRRFFDMNFTLPEPDPVEFCKFLMERYELHRVLYRRRAPKESGVQVEVDLLVSALPLLVGNMGLSLRDMDYCVRVVSLAVASDRGRALVDQYLFAGLVALKVANPGLYRRYMEGSARGAQVVDYFNDLTRANRRRFSHHLMYDDEGLDRIAAAIYCADDAFQVRSQLLRLVDHSAPDHPEYLSQEHQRLGGGDSERLERILKVVDECMSQPTRFGLDRDALAPLIDLG